jgi:hypothetical protein
VKLSSQVLSNYFEIVFHGDAKAEKIFPDDVSRFTSELGPVSKQLLHFRGTYHRRTQPERVNVCECLMAQDEVSNTPLSPRP